MNIDDQNWGVMFREEESNYETVIGLTEKQANHIRFLFSVYGRFRVEGKMRHPKVIRIIKVEEEIIY